MVENAVVAFASDVWRGRRSVGRLLQAMCGVEGEVWRGKITVITSEAKELFEARAKKQRQELWEPRAKYTTSSGKLIKQQA